MSAESYQKYRMFRNYMANELGIGKEEIRQWTQEAVTREIERVVGQLNIQQLAQNAVDRCLKNGGWGATVSDFNLAQTLGREIAKRLTITLSESPPSGEEKQ